MPEDLTVEDILNAGNEWLFFDTLGGSEAYAKRSDKKVYHESRDAAGNMTVSIISRDTAIKLAHFLLEATK
jgi:hypothetical protein